MQFDDSIAMDKVQTILFPKDKWTIANARSWLLLHGFIAKKVDRQYSPDYYRWRQKPPKKSYRYYTKKLDNGIMFVMHA